MKWMVSTIILKKSLEKKLEDLTMCLHKTQGTHSATADASILMPFSINDDFEEFESQST
jgi:hypothetical protein